jgi:hypothetical protein
LEGGHLDETIIQINETKGTQVNKFIDTSSADENK